MLKTVFTFSIYVHLIFTIIGCKVTNQSCNASKQVKLLEEVVYIPTLGDYYYYKDKYIEDLPYPSPNRVVHEEMIALTTAIYDLYNTLTANKIRALLYHEKPEIRAYAYIFYIGKTNDINFSYLAEMIGQDIVVSFGIGEHNFYGECYLGDVLLFIALNRADIPKIYPRYSNSHNMIYTLRDSLYTVYTSRVLESNNTILSDFIVREIEEWFSTTSDMISE